MVVIVAAVIVVATVAVVLNVVVAVTTAIAVVDAQKTRMRMKRMKGRAYLGLIG